MPRPVTPHGILAATLADLAARAAGSPLADELRAAADLAAGLDPYVERCTSPASPALAALAARTAREPWADGLEQEMLSGHVEGQLLATLVGVTRARRVLDVGMFTGYSSLAMAEALPADGQVVALELDERAVAVAREGFARSAAGALIDVRVGPAAESLAALADEEPFDLVFLDADKGGYVEYLRLILDGGLLADGGVVCADNTLMQGQPWTGPETENGRAIAAFNDAVLADERLVQVLVPVRDGLTLIRRR